MKPTEYNIQYILESLDASNVTRTEIGGHSNINMSVMQVNEQSLQCTVYIFFTATGHFMHCFRVGPVSV